ncbi:MAG: DUF4282 domain-containing protein [Actinomycetota bacterium]|nr:DUF4282 domain-containing protein [Actinomycetota bacterium]
MEKGFFASLFDFSFSSLITPKIIRVVYVLITIAVGLFSLSILFSFAASDDGNAVLGLILAPLAFLLYMIFARIYLEIVIVVFRMGEDVRRIADNQAGGGTPGPRTVI